MLDESHAVERLDTLIVPNFRIHRDSSQQVVETFTDPIEAVETLGADVHVLLVDWEMPEMDGLEVLEAARGAGVNLKRVIISSSHPADRLHEAFDSTGCLAVIEKAEPEQQAAFLMILDSIMKR